MTGKNDSSASLGCRASVFYNRNSQPVTQTLQVILRSHDTLNVYENISNEYNMALL